MVWDNFYLVWKESGTVIEKMEEKKTEAIVKIKISIFAANLPKGFGSIQQK